MQCSPSPLPTSLHQGQEPGLSWVGGRKECGSGVEEAREMLCNDKAAGYCGDECCTRASGYVTAVGGEV